MKVRAYLALVAAGIFVPIIIFSGIALQTLFTAQRQAAFLALQETARLTVVSLDREFATSEAVLRTLAISQNLADSNWKAFHQQARLANHDTRSWILLFDEEGQQIINTVVSFGEKLPLPVAKDQIQQVLAAGKTTVSNLVLGPITKTLLVVVAYPITLDNGKRFVLIQSFSPNYFLRAIPKPRPQWLVGIFDRNGRTIGRSRAPNDLVGQYPMANLLEAIRTQQSEVFRNRSRDNAEVYTGLARSGMSGWTVAVGVPVSEIESAASRAVGVAALGLMVAIMSGALLATLFGRKLANSISEATHSALLLGIGEAPEPKLVGIQELDALHAAQVQAGHVLQQERESRMQVEVEREKLVLSEKNARKQIDEERAKALIQEREARTMAETQNQMKDQFLAMLGHEIRNPLSGIAGAIALMDMPDSDEKRQARARTILKRQSGNLTRIVDDLLDLARVSSGKLTLSLERLNLADAVATCIDTLHATGRSTGHAVSLVAQPAWISADRTRLEQIINNLLGNALKYTPSGGKIDVVVRAEADDAVLVIHDNGVGISADLLPKLFGIFIQGEASLDRAQGGLGIGLALVSKLTQMHGGNVVAHSEGTGCGSTFTVRIPLVAAPATLMATGPVDVPPARKPLRVLLVEDNHDARQVMADMLKEEGFFVYEAADGDAGIKMAIEVRPDVAVIDIGLPGTNGLDVAKSLRAHQATSHIGLIALSGYGQETDRQRSLQAGFNTHFAKPANLDVLARAIRTAIPHDGMPA